jgi:HAE1 family hydrophobic/amphiphilic exporter-1
VVSTIGILMVAAIVGGAGLPAALPKLEYSPEGNRNLVPGLITQPAGV